MWVKGQDRNRSQRLKVVYSLRRSSCITSLVNGNSDPPFSFYLDTSNHFDLSLPISFSFPLHPQPRPKGGRVDTCHAQSAADWMLTNSPSNPIFCGCCLYQLCIWPARHPPLQEQQRQHQSEVSTDQPLRDWPALCQQTSEDERYWSAVSTRVRTAPTHCNHALTFTLYLSLFCSYTRTDTRFRAEAQLTFQVSNCANVTVLLQKMENGDKLLEMAPNTSSLPLHFLTTLLPLNTLLRPGGSFTNDSFYFTHHHFLLEQARSWTTMTRQ